MHSDENDRRYKATPHRLGWATLAGVVLWFGLVTGLGEVAFRLLTYASGSEHLFYNEHFMWLTPVAEAILFVGFGVPLMSPLRRLPSPTALGLVVGASSLAATLGIVVSSGYVYAWVALILAAGVAWRLGHWVRRRPTWTATSCHRTLPFLLGTVAVLAGLVFARQADQDAAARTQAAAADPRVPNVILVVLDTVRADSLRMYREDGVGLPFLERLATRGLVYESAIAPAPWTLPSHASMFTGRYPNELSTGWFQPLDDRQPTLAEVLGQAGYATSGFVGNTLYCPRTTGLRRGFGHYEDFGFGWGEVFRHSVFVRNLQRKLDPLAWFGFHDELGRKPAPSVTNGFLRWLDRPGSRPFFAFLNYFDAHSPYLPARLANDGRRLTDREQALSKRLAEAEHAELQQHADFLRQCYESTLVELDAELRRLADELAQRQLLDNTILVVTSDHGELFGEHGVFYHGNSLYRPAVHVPLLVSWPSGIRQAQRIQAGVSLKDLPATILDFLDLSSQTALPGTSFRPRSGPSSPQQPRPVLSMVDPGPKADRFSRAPVAKGPMWACLDDGIFLIREGDGTERAFDFAADPREAADLTLVPEYAERLNAVREAARSESSR